jgi:UDP-N-acetylmuramoyl-tripeptide--D-alanyl-D-alanine ligase
MDLNLSFVSPGYGILTRLSHAHSEFMGGIESITAEKVKLLKQLPENGFAILNYDDSNIRKIADDLKSQVIFYGTSSKDCLVWASNIRIKDYQTYFELNHGVERVEVKFPLLGKHQIYPALAAAALGISCGMSLSSIKKGLEKIEAAPHRLQAVKGILDSVILDDTYNSSPVAVEEALNVLQELPARKRIVVLGEMRELGKYSEELHRKIAQKIYKDKVDYVLLGGGDTKYISDELFRLGYSDDRLLSNLTNPQIAANLSTIIQKGDLVLIKASRAVRLDEVVQRLTKGARS